MKTGLIIAWLILLFAGIAVLFWRNEWIYSLPTPVPAGYRDVRPGSTIDLSLQGIPAGKRPVFLHFFNPDCPCSRFNISLFKSLVTQYEKEVDFSIVLMTDKKYTAGEIRDKFDLPHPIPVLMDKRIAVSCGVYSTPQAVILDDGEKLFYRGNYNRSRYCSDEKTSYAKIALDGLLHNNLVQIFSPLALKAYGCQLPICNK
jgi:hypothetical protein